MLQENKKRWFIQRMDDRLVPDDSENTTGRIRTRSFGKHLKTLLI